MQNSRQEPNQTKKGKKVLPVVYHLLYLVLLTSLVCAVTFAKYSTSIVGVDSVKVAKYNLTYSDNSASAILSSLTPSSPKNAIIITVSSDQSEVSLEYDLNLSYTQNIPLEINVFSGADNSGEKLLTINSATPSATTSRFSFAHSQTITHNYYVEIGWQSGMSSSDYSGEIDVVKITANWSQMD